MIKTRKVAIYVRVSTTNQVEEGYSIQGQLDSLTKYCEAMGWTISETYTDAGFSGGKLERPAISKLIADAKRKRFDTILVYKLDRLSRSVRDTLYLVKEVFTQNQVHFVSLQENLDTSSAMGNLFLTLLSAIAEFEREQIKERMQLGLQGRAKSGKTMMWGNTAYGYTYRKDKSTLEINPAEALIVQSIYKDYLAGQSINKIRANLINQNITSKQAPWTLTSVRRVLSNPVYTGRISYKGEIYPGQHESIIDIDTFEKVQSELKMRQTTAAERFNPRPFQAKYMLSGLAKCGYCGTPLEVIPSPKRKDGTRTYRYQCRNRYPRKTGSASSYNNNQKCDSGYYHMTAIEDYVLTQLQKFQSNPDSLNELFDSTEPALDRESLLKQIGSLDNKIERLNDLYIDDRISLAELQTKSDHFQQQKQLLEQELESDNSLDRLERKNQMLKTLDCDDVKTLAYNQQSTIAKSLIDTVTVRSEAIEIKWKI